MPRLLVLILPLLFLVSFPAHADWSTGVSAFRAGDYERAVQEFQAVVAQNPGAFQGHYLLGLSLAQLERGEQALDHLRKAYDLNPNDLAVKLALARAYDAVGRDPEVARLLSSIDPVSLPISQQAPFYRLRGVARSRTGDEAGALSDVKQLARLQPGDPDVQQLLADLADQLGQLDAALAASAAAARLAPNDPNVQRSYVQRLNKVARLTRDREARQQRYRQGAESAATLVAMSPTYEDQLLAAQTQLGAGMWTEAAESSRAAIALNDGEWLPHFYLGQALASAERYAEALGPLQAALALAPRDGTERRILTQLGFVHERQGTWQQAVEAYEQAGDEASIARVRENERTAQENRAIEVENEQIRQMEEEARLLEEQLKELEGGGGR